VITDALEMGGIAKGFSSGEACVRALEAGADTLLMPTDPDAALRAVLAAEQSGRITRQRVQESVIKILSAKERVGLDRKRFTDTEAMADVIESPQADQKAQEIADRAVTLVRNNSNLVPLAAPDQACFVVMPENRYSAEGQVFTQQVRKRAPRASITTLEPAMPVAQIDDTLGKLAGCPSYAIAAFASVSASRGSVGLAGELPHAVEALVATGKPIAFVALGNPYLLRSFPNVTAYLATFSTVPPSETAAVKALWGEIAIRGRLPVSIPEVAKIGDGMQTQATRSGPGAGGSQ
jgi:beta-N-acetylhexosaminidase